VIGLKMHGENMKLPPVLYSYCNVGDKEEGQFALLIHPFAVRT